MLDFTNCSVNKYRAYGGANGNKINISYDGASYMLKFPPSTHKNPKMSYSNGCISEYIACHVFEILGFNVQETLLGTYSIKEKEKVVVACRDFTDESNVLVEFAQLKNTCIDSMANGYGTELSSIMDAIQEQSLIPSNELQDFFWDMFIADALLGNFDRHNGNWGILVDEKKQQAKIAPVFDCGSCLYPQLVVKDMERYLQNQSQIDERIFVFPNSIIRENDQKINYFDFISSLKNKECTMALKRIAPRIDLNKINRMIDETPYIEPVQKKFYQRMLKERKSKIIDFSLNKVRKQQLNRTKSAR